MASKRRAKPAAASGADKRIGITTVRIDRRVLEGFRRRAKRSYPREFMEAMFGQITVEGEAHVHVLYPFEHRGDRANIHFDPVEYVYLEGVAHEKGLHLIGTIHTHPSQNTCCHPSDLDNQSGLAYGEHVMGVMHLWKQDGVMHTRLTWNVPRKPVKMVYAPRGG